MRSRVVALVVLGLGVTDPASAAQSFLSRVFTDAGNAPSVLRGGVPSSGPQSQPYTEISEPVYFESAPGIVITGSDLAGGSARATWGEVAVSSRAAQGAQGGTLQFYGTSAEARAFAEFVLDDLEITALGPGPPPLFVPAVFRFTIEGRLPDLYAGGQISDTFLSANFPNEIFADARTQLLLRVSLRDADGGLSANGGGTAQRQAETTFASGTHHAALSADGALFAGLSVLEGGLPFVAEIPFLAVPVGQPLTLTVSLEAISLVGYGFPENGGFWETEAVVAHTRAAFAQGAVATLPAGFTLNSPGGSIVNNVFVPEPTAAAWAAGGALGLLALARSRRLSRRRRERGPGRPGPAIAILALSLVLASGAQAAVVTWHYTGTVFLVGPSTPFGVGPGQLVEGSIAFESESVDDDPDPDSGTYIGALVSWTLSIPDAAFSEAFPPFLPGINSVFVQRQIDRLEMEAGNPDSTLVLLIDTAIPLATDSLPLNPPPFAPADSNQVFRQAVGDGDNWFAARIDSITVPEPRSGASAAYLLLFAAWRRRRWRRSG